MHDFGLSAISSLTWAPGKTQGTLGVLVNGTKTEFTAVPKPDGQPIVDRVRAVISGLSPVVPPAPPSSFGVSDLPLSPHSEEEPAQPADAAAFPAIVEQLRQLAELRDCGVITAADFESKKAELLARI